MYDMRDGEVLWFDLAAIEGAWAALIPRFALARAEARTTNGGS